MNIMLSDSHAMFRDGVRPFLSSMSPNASIDEAGNFPETIAIIARSGNIDIALISNAAPDMDLRTVMAMLGERHPEARSALLATGECQSEALDAIDMGFSGYIPKRLPIGAFLAALDLIRSGELFVPASLLAQRHERPATPSPKHEIDLTPREAEVMELLRQGMPNKVIARTLNISDVTVKCHLGHIFDKLGVTNRVQAARFSFHSD